MKKLLSIIGILITFSGCSNVVENGKKSYDKTVDELGKAKDKTVETVNDINTAIDTVQDAKQAIKEVTE